MIGPIGKPLVYLRTAFLSTPLSLTQKKEVEELLEFTSNSFFYSLPKLTHHYLPVYTQVGLRGMFTLLKQNMVPSPFMASGS